MNILGVDGMAGVYSCQNVDLLSVTSASQLGYNPVYPDDNE